MSYFPVERMGCFPVPPVGLSHPAHKLSAYVYGLPKMFVLKWLCFKNKM